MLRRINEVLPELILEIILYGVVIQLAGVWFVDDKLLYSTGLWLGIAAAALMAIHMAVVILDSVDSMLERKAKIRTTVYSVLRYVAVVAAFIIVAYFKLGNILAMFVGVMGLKAAAYFYPFTHKFILKLKERGRGDKLHR